MSEPHELRYHITLTYHARPGHWPGRYSCCARGPIHVEPGATLYFGTDQ